jgi:phosphoglycolate phosphatase
VTEGRVALEMHLGHQGDMQNWTLVFDLDGTLVDTAPDLVASTNHVMNRLGLQCVAEADIRPYVGHGALAMMERAAAAQGRPLSQPELYGLFEVFIAHYTANIANLSKPYDGVEAALKTCKDNGAVLAVCTNKLEAHARAVLGALDMAHYFSAVTGRDSLNVFKPDPGHLTGTIALAGGHTLRAIMVGDSETDVRTAQAANIPVIAVDFGYSAEPIASFNPDAVISHYDDLTGTAQTLMRGTKLST